MAWLLIAGCDLSVTSGPALVATWERDCIRTLDTGSTTPLGNTIVLTSACTDASLVEHVAYYDDVLTQVSSGTLPGYRYQRVVLAELDDGPGPDVVGVVDDGRGYVVWPSGLSAPPWAVEHARAVRDLAVTDLDGDGLSDVVVAGDGAIRAVLGTAGPPDTTITARDEVVLLSEQRFVAVAVTWLAMWPAAPAIRYIADQPDGSFGLGVARRTGSDPLAYEVIQTEGCFPPSGSCGVGSPITPPVVADVDGDDFPDVITAQPYLEVWSTRYGWAIHGLEAIPRAIAAGDVDGDGRAEAVYVDADGTAVRRVEVVSGGELASEQVLAAGGSALAVSDLDADGVAEVLLVEGRLGFAGTRVAVYSVR